ncbi:MAG: AraC family transcriptional regulator, partial [Phycisphaeraceae bacterium]
MMRSVPDRSMPTVGEPVVRRVLLCDRIGRDEPGRRGESTSLPGHLLQLMLTGRSEHEVEGRRYTLEPGHLIWYHEDELVRTHVTAAPWSFYTLNFLAPALAPPPFERRVHRVGEAVRQRFVALEKVWRDRTVSANVRELRVHAAVHALLAEVLGTIQTHAPEPFVMDQAAQLWWQLESRLRQDLSRPLTLADLAALVGRSPATIARACHAAVGEAPMKRLKHIRMSLAAGLVRRSDLRMTEIAERIGYARPHEFSRDYRKHFGLA